MMIREDNPRFHSHRGREERGPNDLSGVERIQACLSYFGRNLIGSLPTSLGREIAIIGEER